MSGLVRIGGIPVRNVTLYDALRAVLGFVERREHRSVFFVNAHCVNVSVGDPAYLALLRRDDSVVFGDGIGVRIAGWLLRRPLLDNVNGTDMFPLLCRAAAERGLALYLLGGQPGVADEVARRMPERYPGLRIAGAHHGFFEASRADELVSEINASQADVLLVGFGVPAQEKWIAAQRDRLSVPVAMGIGGLFDYFSGRIPRAPLALRRLGLEWAWRLAMEPGRMWRRYLLGNASFLARVLWWSVAGREP